MKNSGFIVSLLSSMLMLNASAEVPPENQMHPMFSYLVGTYTDNKDQGIHLLAFDSETMTLSSKVIAKGINNPSFVIANKAKNLVFAVEEIEGKQDGHVKLFTFNKEKQSLERIDTANTFGGLPCYLSLDPLERFLVAANYAGGNFSVYRISEGKLVHLQTVQHEGRSINKYRQQHPHVHSAVFHPNGKQLLVADLGTDKIHIYDFHPDSAVPFTPASPAYFQVTSGAGPRHLAIHPDGGQIYLVHELTAELGVYDYNDGKFTQSQILPLTAQGFVGSRQAAEVRFSADGKFVYASNRGDANEISVFEIIKDGKLSLVQRISSGGKTPRNFIPSADGQFLLAANQQSSDIQIFKIDNKTGRLTPTDTKLKINKPAYLFPLN